MGGLRSVLGAPTADDVVTEGLLPLGTHRTQTFKGGKIYAYNYGQWRAYWLPTELAKEYDRLSNPGRLPEEQFGDLSYDAYPISVGEGMAVRADAENGSLIWYKPSGKIDVLTPKLNISAEYYNNTSLSGYPDVNRLEKNIQFTWGSGSPHPLISSEGFSARYSETINIMLPGLHTFYAWTDGGVRITLDGDLILDRWNNTIAGKFSGTKLTGIGDHKLVYEYRHTQGNSRFWAAYAPAGVQIAWAGEDTQGAYNSLPAMAPGFTPSQLNFIESIKQQIQAWWDEQSGSIRGSLEAWWNTLVNDVKQRTETWATEQWNKMVEQIRQYIETWVSEEWQKFLQTTAQDLSIWLNQICAGVFVLIALPFAMVAMHKQRG
jgi:hypothetical protein